jgi:acetyl-CoA carboxylase biotin carboxylase subunit
MKRLERALAELVVKGIRTTKPLHQALARNDEVRGAKFDTGWLERWLPQHRSALAQITGGEQG